MKQDLRAPRGTQNILPGETTIWQRIESKALEICQKFGFFEIRVPTFEYTGLFTKSVGDSTDVVQKEMFTFLDRGGRSLSLRPEGTAGTVRAVLESGIINDALPLKVFYLLTCFRNERPQAGRFKEFHQFGAELFGSDSPIADVEIISMASCFFDELGIKGLKLNLNSIGCKNCRTDYYHALIDYYKQHVDKLCDVCLERLYKNPMRLLDCKTKECSELAKGAPKIIDYLCNECNEHFESVKKLLSLQKIEYTINPTIVRGLDYYTKTVFEFTSNELGAQSTVCGGGRYDSLVEMMGGKPTPALGYGIGMERLILIMKAQNNQITKVEKSCYLYIGNMGDEAVSVVFDIARKLREKGFSVQTDLMSRSIKAQMKYADKIGAHYSCIIGDLEMEKGVVKIKDMQGDNPFDVSLESFEEEFCRQFKDRLN